LVTSYKLTDGYSGDFDRDEIWQELLVVVDVVREDTNRIVSEVLRVEPKANKKKIQELAMYYKKPAIDLTIQIRENEECREVLQLATGGGLKESVRRAFCRIVIDEMHKRKMEVSLIVA
jgi:hypothetical protein